MASVGASRNCKVKETKKKETLVKLKYFMVLVALRRDSGRNDDDFDDWLYNGATSQSSEQTDVSEHEQRVSGVSICQ